MTRTSDRGQARPMRRAARTWPLAVGLASIIAAGACRQDMHDAPRYDPLEASPVFANGASERPLVVGTVARDHLDADELLYTGKINGQVANVFPFAITAADMDRGQQRYNIYCAPCHDRTGSGNGMVVQRGYRQAASYHVDRLREAPVGYFFDVITNGFGNMPDYKAQIPVADRWRIIAYVRALVLAHSATAADVPADEMNKLNNPPAAAPAAAPSESGEPR
ncbi:MAG TPA: cytochrome c [Vicinamibacterales bacterium]|nr:cytochrome c [Vicinamibacterales bacterium]